MNDSRKGLEAKTKRELVALLAAEVREWTGDAPMPPEQRASAEALTEMLGHCTGIWGQSKNTVVLTSSKRKRNCQCRDSHVYS